MDTTVRQQIQQLIADTMKSAEVQAQIEEAVQKAAAGRDSIQTLRKQLDSYQDRKSTRLNSSHRSQSRMPSSA